MTKQIDTSELLPEEFLALGRSRVHEIQAGSWNQQSYNYWKKHLFNLVLSMFTWEGLPPEIDPRFVEYVLCREGLGGFFAMKRGTAMWAFCPAAPMGNLNMYYNPNKIMLTPVTGGVPWYRHAYYFMKGAVMYEPNAVVGWNNKARTSMMPVIRYYARRLAHIDRIIDVNVGAQSTPYLVVTDEMHRRDAENFTLQLCGHSSVITVNDKFADGVAVSTVPTTAPFVADKLFDLQVKLLNQFNGLIGIDNTNTEKRERVSDKEATSNNEQIMVIRNSCLECRKELALGIAKLTGGMYEPTVKYTVPYREDGTVDMSWGGDKA